MHAGTLSRRSVVGGLAGGAALAAVGAPVLVGAAGKATVAYSPITCQGALFAAREQGYFRDEGLELTTVVSGPDTNQRILAGEIDGQQGIAWLAMTPFLPSGLNLGDLLATAGVQRGGISLIAAPRIGKLADLKGQKVAAALVWRWMLAPALADVGLDPRRDVDWQAGLGAGPAAEAIKAGTVAAAMVAEPGGVAAESAGVAKILGSNNSLPMIQDDYCCSVNVSARLVASDRPKAAAITRAIMRGSAWIRANPREAAQMLVDTKFVNASAADNLRAVQMIDWAPSVASARRNTLDMLMHFKQLGFLAASTDEEALLNRFFQPVGGELAAPAPTQLPRTGGLPLGGLFGAGAAALGAALLLRRRGAFGR